jgi:hypothetical protein
LPRPNNATSSALFSNVKHLCVHVALIDTSRGAAEKKSVVHDKRRHISPATSKLRSFIEKSSATIDVNSIYTDEYLEFLRLFVRTTACGQRCFVERVSSNDPTDVENQDQHGRYMPSDEGLYYFALQVIIFPGDQDPMLGAVRLELKAAHTFCRRVYGGRSFCVQAWTADDSRAKILLYVLRFQQSVRKIDEKIQYVNLENAEKVIDSLFGMEAKMRLPRAQYIAMLCKALDVS